MTQVNEITLQQIAEKALSTSIVRLDVEKPITYNDYVKAFEVENSYSDSPIKSAENRNKHRMSLFEMSVASGFFITKHLIVTNFHVVIGAYSVLAKVAGSENIFHVQGVEAFDIKNDLVLLRGASAGTPLRLGDSDSVQNEDGVCAPGYPEGVGKILHGTINNTQNCGNHIKMKIDTSGGSSGCPVINSKGEVIGIDVSGDELYSYAIPSNSLKPLIKTTGKTTSFETWHKHPIILAYVETKEGDMKRQKGEYEDAVIHYDTAINLKPNLVKAYEGRAGAKFGMRAYDEGFADILHVLRLNPVPFRLSTLGAFISWKRNIFQTTWAHLLMRLFKNVFGIGV